MFGSKRRDAIKTHKAADKAFEANSRREQASGITRETPEFRRLNRAVAASEENPALPSRYLDPRDRKRR